MLERLLAFFTVTGFRWVDLLDIVLVAFILYELLRFIRGTHAVQIALGGLVLVVLYWTSTFFNLETVNWLLRTFLPFLFFGMAAKRQKEEVLDEVVLAATTLSSQRTGAILVLEREIGLRSYIETGIALDAVLTYDLLVNVFHPATPLHDGAAIVQGNRVAAAACFLPLTVNPELSRTLGSRHRAAIGLSEDTDAVAVVVSEETGAISVVEDGQIRRGLDGPALRRWLLVALGLGAEGAAESRAVAASGGPR
jgi:diadenylate cyclase